MTNTDTVTPARRVAPIPLGGKDVLGNVIVDVPAGKDAIKALRDKLGHVPAPRRKFVDVRGIDRVIVAIRGPHASITYYAAPAKWAREVAT